MLIGSHELKSGRSFIIAELSANHNQDKCIAMDTIAAIADAGADAVKFQTYTPDTITIDCDNEYFQIRSGTIWDGMNLYKLYQQAYTPWEWHQEMAEYALSLGLQWLSSPFDLSAVDFLEGLSIPAYKIASFEITDIPLIEYVASKGKPVIISTGIAGLDDISLALDACHRMANRQIVLLKCTSSYPAPYTAMNLRMIPDFKQRFGVRAGLSDHSMGLSVPIASVALGADVIEKHFILSREMGGPDSSFSMEPEEFRAMVDGVRKAEDALGNVDYQLTKETMLSRRFSRSLFVVEDVQAGQEVTAENVRSIRPSDGLHPRFLGEVIGSRFATAVKRGTPLQRALLAT